MQRIRERCEFQHGEFPQENKPFAVYHAFIPSAGIWINLCEMHAERMSFDVTKSELLTSNEKEREL